MGVSEGKKDTDYHEFLHPSTRYYLLYSMGMNLPTDSFRGTRTSSPPPAIPQVPSASLTYGHTGTGPLSSPSPTYIISSGPCPTPATAAQPTQLLHISKKTRPHLPSSQGPHHDANRFLSFLCLPLPTCLSHPKGSALDTAVAHSSPSSSPKTRPLSPVPPAKTEQVDKRGLSKSQKDPCNALYHLHYVSS